MTPERRSEIETILDHMNYSWTRRESDAIRDLFAEIDRLREAEWEAQRDRTLKDGHQMRFDALVETMQREGAQAEAIERERDALRDVVNLMDVDGKRQAITALEDPHVRLLCERYGYGAVMDSAARQWRAKDPVGAFLVGPCVATAQAVLDTTRTQEDT